MHWKTLRTPVLMKVLKIELAKILSLIKALKTNTITPEKSEPHQRLKKKNY